MADVVYNPLLKRNIQYLGDSGDVDAKIAALQNAINDLQSRLNDLKNTKITKVTAAAQLSDLTNGEIFEWQTTTTQQFTQGYFYQKNGNNYTRVDLQPQYNLPIAAADVLGGVKVGSGLNIDGSGVLSVTGGDGLKVPRCFTDAQIAALTDGDIFEWQGDTTADYTQGYFYKKTSNTTVEVQAGDYYVKVSQSHERKLGNYSIKQGYYTFVENKTTLWVGYCQSYNPSVSSYRYYTNYPAVVGQKVAKCSNNVLSSLQLVEWVTVASIDENGKPATFSDGAVYNQYSASTGNVGNLAVFQAVDGTQIGVGIALQNNLNVVGMIFAIDNDVWYPLNFYCSLIKTQAATDIIETTIITNRVDTQTRELSISNNNQLQFTDNNGNVYNIPQNSNLADGSLLQWSNTTKSIVIAERNVVWNQKTVTFVNGSLTIQLDSWLFIFGRVVTVILQGVKSIGSDYVNQTLSSSSSDTLPIEARPAYSRRVVCPAMVSDVLVGYIALRVNPTGQLLLNCSYAQQVEFYASLTYVI